MIFKAELVRLWDDHTWDTEIVTIKRNGEVQDFWGETEKEISRLMERGLTHSDHVVVAMYPWDAPFPPGRARLGWPD